MRRLRRPGVLAYLGLAVASPALIAFGLLLPTTMLTAIALAASSVEGAGISVFGIIWNTVPQKLVPADKLGLVSSVHLLGFVAAGVVGVVPNASGLWVRGIRN